MRFYVNEKYSWIQLERCEDLLLGESETAIVHSPAPLKE